MNARLIAITLLAAFAFLLSSCSTPSTLEPLSISLDYERMAEAPMFRALPECARLSAVTVDSTEENDTIGVRWIEDRENVTAPVTVSSDLTAWVRDGAVQALESAGASLGAEGAPSLHLTIDRIRTQENVLHRAGYDCLIDLSAKLMSGTETCWTGRLEGADGNYGYAGNPLAYHEMLNEALDVAMIELLDNTELRSSICTCE